MNKNKQPRIGEALPLKPARAEAYGLPINAAPVFVSFQKREGYSKGFVIADFNGQRGYYRESDFK